MTIKRFISILNRKGYSYEMEGDKIIITGNSVLFEKLSSLPPNVHFNNSGNVHLESITSLPRGIEFNNSGWIVMERLTELPSDVVFNNSGRTFMGVTIEADLQLTGLRELNPDVNLGNCHHLALSSITQLPYGYRFNNSGNVNLNSLTSLPPGIEFNNGGDVNLDSLIGKRFWFGDWEGNTEDINPNRLLNTMIKKGIFE